MALLNTQHDDPASAALTITHKRAEKVARLIDSDMANIALRHADSLVADVLDWCVNTPGSGRKAMMAKPVAEIALSCRQRALVAYQAAHRL